MPKNSRAKRLRAAVQSAAMALRNAPRIAKKTRKQRKAKRANRGGRVQRARAPIGGSTRGANSMQKQLIFPSAQTMEEEYVADVTLTSASFVNTQYAVNPGNSALFPYLAPIAAQFQKYRFLALEFVYRRIASEFATAGQTGDIILSFNPDASDPAPVNQAQVYDLQMRCNALPSESFALNNISIKELSQQDSYYVRPGAQPANTDIKTYDCGNLNVSTIGTAASGTPGKLFVRYRVLLHSPTLSQQAGGGVIHFAGTAPTTANNFVGATAASGSTPALTAITLGTNTITFPAGLGGNYFISFFVAGSTSATAAALTAGAGATNLSMLTFNGVKDSAVNQNSVSSATANVGVMSNATFTIAASGGSVTLTPSTLVGGNAMDLFIVSLPSALVTLTETREAALLQALVDRESRLADLEARLEKRLMLLAGEEPPKDSDDEFESVRRDKRRMK